MGCYTLHTSHLISKYFANFGNARMRALVNSCIRVPKDFSCFSSHLNPTFILTISFKGTAKVLKLFTNLL